MNELLGWYGYENYNTNLKQSSNNLKVKEKQNENETRDSTSWMSRESSRSPLLSIVGKKGKQIRDLPRVPFNRFIV